MIIFKIDYRRLLLWNFYFFVDSFQQCNRYGMWQHLYTRQNKRIRLFFLIHLLKYPLLVLALKWVLSTALNPNTSILQGKDFNNLVVTFYPQYVTLFIFALGGLTAPRQIWCLLERLRGWGGHIYNLYKSFNILSILLYAPRRAA